MKKLIIMGQAAQAGAMIMTSTGVRPIPLFAANIMSTLESCAAMMKAITETTDQRVRSKMARTTITLSNLAVSQLEQVVGPLDADNSVIYLSDDGGFSCGSSGKPPIQIVWPPKPLPSVPDLIASGAIESDLVDLIHKVRASNIPMIEV